MPNKLAKLLTTLTSSLVLVSVCSPARADFGAIYAQQSISNLNFTLQDSNNRIMNDQLRRSQSGSGNSRSNSSKPSQRASSGDTRSNLIAKMSDPAGKKFLAKLLTPETAKKLFGAINADETDIVDVFAVGTLYSFSIIESKGFKQEQLRGTRNMFKKIFEKVRAKNADEATLQRARENMLYWTLLVAYSEIKAEENPQELAKVKVAASSYMTSLGISPQKFTLTNSGIRPK
jgi:hypothetical protein